MKLVSWNVNGLRACLGKGLSGLLRAGRTRTSSACRRRSSSRSRPCSIWTAITAISTRRRKGYSGTAVLTKAEPLSVRYGLGDDAHDHEGRVITAEYPAFYLVCCYTPNSQDGLKRLDYRMQWEDALRAYLLRLDAEKPVVYCGISTWRTRRSTSKTPKTNRRNAGFTDEERAKTTGALHSGFADTFRRLHPDTADAYSWWSYRFHAREKNAGWRIDYFIVSERLMPRCSRPRSARTCRAATTARWCWSWT